MTKDVDCRWNHWHVVHPDSNQYSPLPASRNVMKGALLREEELRKMKAWTPCFDGERGGCSAYLRPLLHFLLLHKGYSPFFDWFLPAIPSDRVKPNWIGSILRTWLWDLCVSNYQQNSTNACKVSTGVPVVAASSVLEMLVPSVSSLFASKISWRIFQKKEKIFFRISKLKKIK